MQYLDVQMGISDAAYGCRAQVDHRRGKVVIWNSMM